MSKFVEANEKIANGVVEGYKKIENGVVEGYKKIENGVVGGFEKISDKFVDTFLTKEGETVEEAKARLEKEQKERSAKTYATVPQTQPVDLEKLQQEHKEMIKANMEKSLNAGKNDK